MPFTVRESRLNQHPYQAVYQAALGAIEGLEGRAMSGDAEAGQIQAKFDKKFLGKVLGDRTQIELKIDSPFMSALSAKSAFHFCPARS